MLLLLLLFSFQIYALFNVFLFQPLPVPSILPHPGIGRPQIMQISWKSLMVSLVETK